MYLAVLYKILYDWNCCLIIYCYHGHNSDSFVITPDFVLASDISVLLQSFFIALSGIKLSVKSARDRSPASAIEPEKYAPYI